MKKNILIVFPHNFFELKSGIHRRVYELVKYFHDRDFEVDLLAAKNFESDWLEGFPFDKGLVENLYFYNHSDSGKKNIGQILSIVKKNIRKLVKFNNTFGAEKSRINSLPDFANNEALGKFNMLLEKKKYSHIVVSYIYYAKLVENNPLTVGVNKILLVEDFITSQLFDYAEGNIETGAIFEEEIRRINLFDIVICLSSDELNLFSTFAKKPKYFYIPVFMNKNIIKEYDNFKYDILFIGFNNFHNVNGIRWFLEEVAPNINKNYKILIVGNVIEEIDKRKYPNAEFIEYVESLDEIYLNSKICISPLFTGSGMKVKIVEAMSYGKPVVCSSRSLVGFPIKNNCGCSIADNHEDFAIAIKKLLQDDLYYKEECLKSYTTFSNYFEKKKVYIDLDKIFK